MSDHSTAPDAQFVKAAEQIKRVCAPPPENDLRGYKRRQFLQRYFMRQDDALHEILRREGERDPKTFLPLAGLAQYCMRAAQLYRFATQSAFSTTNGTRRWAHQKPERAKKWVGDDLAFVHCEIERLASKVEAALSGGHIGQAAVIALRLIDFEAAAGVRLAALKELANKEPDSRVQLAALVDLIDHPRTRTAKTPLSVQS